GREKTKVIGMGPARSSSREVNLGREKTGSSSREVNLGRGKETGSSSREVNLGWEKKAKLARTGSHGIGDCAGMPRNQPWSGMKSGSRRSASHMVRQDNDSD